MLLISGDGAIWMRNALRRSGGSGIANLDGRNRECRCCFSQFTADLQEIANAGSAKAVVVLEIYNGFARNGADSNGFQGTPNKGVPCF